MSTETKVEATEATMDIAELFTEDTYKPLQLRKVVNGILKSVDSDAKELPGPMFYTYVKKGYIKADEAKVIQKADAIEWTSKYLAKRFSA